ncbi:hypothetical protein TNCV_1706381 [Trichonephila clavipes]|nr:hypothetical protein TNCV_1706381 [Trichonephila clavipes]
MSVIAHQTEKELISANERKANKECHKHRLRAQQSNMQPDLRKLICEHIIRVLQHQKDDNQKQYICVKHDFVVSNHTKTQSTCILVQPSARFYIQAASSHLHKDGSVFLLQCSGI